MKLNITASENLDKNLAEMSKGIDFIAGRPIEIYE
jgi:hypothetical protein